ncbi:hypothetical protein GAO09_26020 [Rhizobiales bacterium RZME27]|uniref:DUF6894 domain-containing protein n=1 Tax=Endobacterium cereale TaxID=2663029 RepID=A0A6A8AK05_9HYPH|nr:hypothetical protein [Endobacterium cereale]MEB2843886.1 hypothetical protein [Endobacterium cereale]MQY49496.1 hypothetical protein [Endobacterium cereale]
MPRFYLHISDGKQAEVAIDAENAHAAMNDGLNALSTFACRNFPPPDDVSITVLDDRRRKVGRMRFSFDIEYAEAVVM